MKGSQTISALLSDFWFIDPVYGMTHQQVILNLISGKAPIFGTQGQADQSKPIIPSSQQNVGILQITGPVFKYDGMCGEPGYLTYGSQFDALLADDSVSIIFLVIDSPGGQGNGLRTFAQKVKNSTKPVIGFVSDGMCCSAAYWIASQCSWIIASQPTDTIGSIGAYMIIINYLLAAENEGTPLIEIYSSLSTEKNLPTREALKGNVALIVANLDEMVQIYIDDVKEARGDKLNLDVADPFKGAAYMAQSTTGIDALSIGLIDEIGSFEYALDFAFQAGSDPNFFINQSSNMKFPKVITLAAKKADEVSETELAAINAELTEAGIVDFGIFPESVITEASNATAALAELNETIATQKGTITTFGDNAKKDKATIAQLTTELQASKDRVAELEGKNLAGGNSGKKPKSAGDSTAAPDRELNSWEKKAMGKFSAK